MVVRLFERRKHFRKAICSTASPWAKQVALRNRAAKSSILLRRRLPNNARRQQLKSNRDARMSASAAPRMHPPGIGPGILAKFPHSDGGGVAAVGLHCR
jgi:hypothetical protein